MSTNPEERAREFLSPYFDMLDALGPANMNRDVHSAKLAASYAQVQAEARERLAAWMIEHSFSTGHGDTFEDLLKELDWQVKELRFLGRDE